MSLRPSRTKRVISSSSPAIPIAIIRLDVSSSTPIVLERKKNTAKSSLDAWFQYELSRIGSRRGWIEGAPRRKPIGQGRIPDHRAEQTDRQAIQHTLCHRGQVA